MNQRKSFRQDYLTAAYADYAIKQLDAEIAEAAMTEDLYANYFYRVCQMQLLYTAGADINVIEPLLTPAIEWQSERLAYYETVYGEDYLLIPEDNTNEAYLLISLCILFNQEDLLNEFCKSIFDYPSLVLDGYLQMIWPHFVVDEDEPLPRGYAFRKKLKQAIEATTEQETIKHLKAYLRSWYGAFQKIGNTMIDGHLKQEDAIKNRIYTYFGYWCFEAAAVAYLKNIDDTALHECIWYPKDMVQYARQKYPLDFDDAGQVILENG